MKPDDEKEENGMREKMVDWKGYKEKERGYKGIKEDVRGIRRRRRERKREQKEEEKGVPEEGRRGKHDPPQNQAYSRHLLSVSSPAPLPFSC